MTFAPQPKGKTRKQIKAKQDRHEAAVEKIVRAKCVIRDGYCRALRDGYVQSMLYCSGWSQWAHLGDKKRARTRGMDPEIRHTTAGSLMLCQKHHADYDQGRLLIDGSDANGHIGFEPAS